jgi:hypothetical protein
MNRAFWTACLTATLCGGAVAFATVTGEGPVGGHLNPGEATWAASTGQPDDASPAVSEEQTPKPPAGLDSAPDPVRPAKMSSDGDG